MISVSGFSGSFAQAPRRAGGPSFFLVAWLALLLPGLLHAHTSSSLKITAKAFTTITFSITPDVDEGQPSFYSVSSGINSALVYISPEYVVNPRANGTDPFSTTSRADWHIVCLAPGTTTITFNWSYPPNDAIGSFTLELTIVPADPADPNAKKDSAANSVSSATAGDPVNLFTGELTLSTPADLDLGGPLPLFFARHYASGLSRDAVMTSRLTDNWSCNFDWSAVRQTNRVDIISSRGRRISFAKNGVAWQLTNRFDIPFQLVDSGPDLVFGDPRSQRLRTFNPAGQLTTIADGRGNAHSLAYNTNGLLTQVSDGLGRSLNFNYAGNSLISSVSDGQRTVRFGYTHIRFSVITNGVFAILDDHDALASVTNVLGNVTTYSYDVHQNIRNLLLNERRSRESSPPSWEAWDFLPHSPVLPKAWRCPEREQWTAPCQSLVSAWKTGDFSIPQPCWQRTGVLAGQALPS